MVKKESPCSILRVHNHTSLCPDSGVGSAVRKAREVPGASAPVFLASVRADRRLSATRASASCGAGSGAQDVVTSSPLVHLLLVNPRWCLFLHRASDISVSDRSELSYSKSTRSLGNGVEMVMRGQTFLFILVWRSL